VPRLAPRRFNESVTVLRLIDSSILVTPLGIYIDGEKFYANIYPGTRLSEKAPKAYEACILFPFNVKPFYYSSLNIGKNIETREPRYISTPCPNYDGILVEAVITARTRRGDKLRLELAPLASYTRGEPRPYSRDYGCSIELLIALTRIKFWASSTRPIPCNKLVKLFSIVIDSLQCILHATWDEEIHRLAITAAKEAEKWLHLSGCA